MDQILKIEESRKIDENIVHSWYKKSHNRYKPSEQITRDYREPFDKSIRFGKSPKIQPTESRIKTILVWINHEPVTMVSRQQADFVKRTRSSIGQIKDSEIPSFCGDITHGKSIKDEFKVSDSLRDTDLKDGTQFLWQCLQDLINFRRKIKRRLPDVRFLDVEKDLSSLDEKCLGVLPEETIFAIFEKYRIFPNRQFLTPLMDTLELRKSGNVNYRGLLNLLNWRRNLPALPEIKPSGTNSKYITTYAESIGTVRAVDSTATMLPRLGIYPNRKNLSDQSSVHALISPSIFTKYGLTHIDFFKARKKEEIRDIFENIGFDFPEDSFDVLWQEGLRMDCTDGVSVETFRQLLASSDLAGQNCNCK